MSASRACLLALVLLANCSHPPPPPPAPPPPPLAEAPPPVRAFARDVRAFEGGLTDAATALRGLERALPVVAMDHGVVASRLSSDIVGVSIEPDRADRVRIALAEALSVMAAGSPAAYRDNAAYRAALATLDRQIRALDPRRSVDEQRAQVVAALEAAKGALYAGAGVAPPPREVVGARARSLDARGGRATTR